MVLACPCGRRYLVAITALHENADGASQAVTPASHAAVTQTDERTDSLGSAPQAPVARVITQTDPRTDWPTSAPTHQSAVTSQDTAAITRTVLLTERSGSHPAKAGIEQLNLAEAAQIAAPKPAVTDDASAAVANTDRAIERPITITPTTLELSFCDAEGRPLGFRDAVTRNVGGDWSLRPGAQAVFRGAENDPRCLGGTPGRWKKYYAGRSPTQFGFDADLAVMFWDPRERRGKAASANVLQGILGNDWKDKLRQIRDERLRVAIG